MNVILLLGIIFLFYAPQAISAETNPYKLPYGDVYPVKPEIESNFPLPVILKGFIVVSVTNSLGKKI